MINTFQPGQLVQIRSTYPGAYRSTLYVGRHPKKVEHGLVGVYLKSLSESSLMALTLFEEAVVYVCYLDIEHIVHSV